MFSPVNTRLCCHGDVARISDRQQTATVLFIIVFGILMIWHIFHRLVCKEPRWRRYLFGLIKFTIVITANNSKPTGNHLFPHNELTVSSLKTKYRIYDLCFNADGSQLIVAAGKKVLVYESHTGNLLHTLKGFISMIRSSTSLLLTCL